MTLIRPNGTIIISRPINSLACDKVLNNEQQQNTSETKCASVHKFV